MKKFIVFLACAVTACNDTQVQPAQQGPRGAPGPQGIPGIQGPPGKSFSVDGTRYKVTQRTITGPDGSLWTYSFPQVTDSLLNAPCVNTWQGQRVTCTPQVGYNLSNFFEEATCTHQLALIHDNTTDLRASDQFRVMTVTRQYTGTIYRGSINPDTNEVTNCLPATGTLTVFSTGVQIADVPALVAQ